MTPKISPAIPPEIEYPDCDGNPMSDNTLQFRWITTIQGNLDGMYRDDPNVFVAGDLLWYPVKGQVKIRTAPDALVAFGRPKGYRGSYKQWVEGGIAPQVVFEIKSPNNTEEELDQKLEFYDRYGVDEYYFYDPDEVVMAGWVRREVSLQPIAQMDGWESPRLGIRFDLTGDELVIYRPDGGRFLTFVEMTERKEEIEGLVELEKQAKKKAERKAMQERQAREKAERLTMQERQAKEEAETRAERLAAKLRALGIDPGDEVPSE